MPDSHQSLSEVDKRFSSPALEPCQRALAERRFYRILDHFNATGCGDAGYSQSKLIRYTYGYAASQKSKDSILVFVLSALGVPIEGNDGQDIELETLLGPLSALADYLVDKFFIPR